MSSSPTTSGTGRAVATGAKLVAAVGLAQVAYAAGVRAVVSYAVGRLREGDIRPLMLMYAKDVKFTFPGSSSWGITASSRHEVEQWWTRFARVGFQLEAREVVVSGPPWRTTICMHFTDQVFDSDGARIYANDGVMLARSSWGKVRVQTIYEDTELGAELDGWLTANRPELAVVPG